MFICLRALLTIFRLYFLALTTLPSADASKQTDGFADAFKLAFEDPAVEQAVVYSTLPQEYSTLTFGGEVLLDGGGVEERSEVMYWHRGAYIIYYRNITRHSCIA